ncbi:MAG TPA: EI24 domain-containing protein [Acidisphaera sp.]|nr:EI24 domain-containing protein [Acidisphaera sp.]
MEPLLLALGQLGDPALLGVILRSVLLAAAAFAALLFAAIRLVHLALHGWMAWAADLASGVGTALLAFWLFLPVAAAIGAIFIERIAAAVERRHYPALPPPSGAPAVSQVWDGVALGLRILLLNVLALLAALLVPGLGLALGWAIGAYAIGRGMFVAVAMRRMPRPAAELLYQRNRGAVLLQGAALALASYVPACNLLLPVVSAATMVHLLDRLPAGSGALALPPR